jgi:alkylation response protein AidB-like acyl-CoA dehydrogenase
MDFDDTPEEADFRKKAHEWLSKNAEVLPPDATAPIILGEGEDEAAIADCKRWQATKADAGWTCLTWPKEYGGQGLTSMHNAIFKSEEAKFQVPADVYTIGLGMLGPTLMAHGTDEQKAKYIPQMIRGQEIWCQLFSEPSAGSDLAGLRTTAVREGDEWVINGQKIWSTGAHFCDWGMVVARSDPNASKHAGLTYFIVDMNAPGVEVRPIRQINGASGFNEVFFTDARVHDDNRLGAEGDGWRVALTTLMNERVAIGAGSSSGRLASLFALARETQLRGSPAIEDGAVRQRLADFYVKSKGLVNTGYRTLSAISRGATPGPEGSIGKAIGAPMGQQMAAFAMELQGPMGAAVEGDIVPQEAFWQDTYLGMPGMRIAGGTDEILKNIIAERVLKLPPEIRVDKDKPFRDVPTGPPGK